MSFQNFIPRVESILHLSIPHCLSVDMRFAVWKNLVTICTYYALQAFKLSLASEGGSIAAALKLIGILLEPWFHVLSKWLQPPDIIERC